MLNLTIVITKKRLLEFFSISNSILAAFDTVLMVMQDSLTQQLEFTVQIAANVFRIKAVIWMAKKRESTPYLPYLT
jgi:hypothetical protein